MHGVADDCEECRWLESDRTARDEEHAKREDDTEKWATVARRRTQTNGEKLGRSCPPLGKAGLRVFIRPARGRDNLRYAERGEREVGKREIEVEKRMSCRRQTARNRTRKRPVTRSMAVSE